MLIKIFPDLKLNGHPKNRLPNTLNVCFKNVNEYFQSSLFQEVAASTGSACHSDVATLSPVLQAMNVPPEFARGAIRFSTGKMTTEKEIKQAVKIIQNLVK